MAQKKPRRIVSAPYTPAPAAADQAIVASVATPANLALWRFVTALVGYARRMAAKPADEDFADQWERDVAQIATANRLPINEARDAAAQVWAAVKRGN